MADQIRSATINKFSVRHGLLIGVVSIVLSLLFRFVDPVMQFANLWVTLFSFAVIITLLVLFGRDIRKKIGDYWSFGEAYKSLIIMTVFLAIVSTCYSFVLFKYIDPALPGKVNSAVLENTTNMLTKFGADQSKIDDSTKQFQNGEFEAKLQPTLKNESIALGTAILLYAVIDLIIAASIKKKQPFG